MSLSHTHPASPVRVLAISPGMAIGSVHLYGQNSNTANLDTRIAPDQVASEQQRLQAALHTAIAELHELSERVAKTVGNNEADIFAAQQLIHYTRQQNTRPRNWRPW